MASDRGVLSRWKNQRSVMAPSEESQVLMVRLTQMSVAVDYIDKRRTVALTLISTRLPPRVCQGGEITLPQATTPGPFIAASRFSCGSNQGWS